MKQLTPSQLSDILTKHRKWLIKEVGGERADLSGANLSDANLVEANLSYVELVDANLRFADLTKADLRGAILIKADLYEANLNDILRL